jgi:ribosomal protein S1
LGIGLPTLLDILEQLLHRRQIPRGAALTAGDVISVEILSDDSDRGRISLGWVESHCSDSQVSFA